MRKRRHALIISEGAGTHTQPTDEYRNISEDVKLFISADW